MRHENQKKGGGRLPPHVWLGYLLVCSALLTGVTFSSYISSTEGSAEARVAKFEVTMSGNKDQIDIDGSDPTNDLSGEYMLTVTNSSEVAVEYSVVIQTETALPKGITLKLDGTAQTTNGSDTAYTFAGGTLAPEGFQDHTLTVVAVLDTLQVDVSQNVTVSVIAEQID